MRLAVGAATALALIILLVLMRRRPTRPGSGMPQSSTTAPPAPCALARAAAGGAEKAGAHVRLRGVAELAHRGAMNAKPAWGQHLQDTTDVAEASLDDLDWADVVLFGTPMQP
jgi:hypothetical protein